MATHSSILKRIPWTKEPGGLSPCLYNIKHFSAFLAQQAALRSHNVKVLSSNLSEHSLGFPGSSAGKESTRNAGDPEVRKIHGRRDRLPTQ